MKDSPPTSRETVRVMAALSDENRFRIVELLAEEKQELSCGAISKALDMSPSLLSHHLSILADAEIIGRRKNGLWTMNVLQRSVIERQVRTLQSLIRSGNGRVVGPLDARVDGMIRLHRDGDGAGGAPKGAVATDAERASDPLSDGAGLGGEAVAGS